jgi:hypothetical protein
MKFGNDLAVSVFNGPLFLLLGCFMVFSSDFGMPDADRLVEASGTITFLKKEPSGKYSDVLRFSLSGQNLDFSYSSKAGETSAVYLALENAGDATVTVLYENDDGFSPLWDDKTYYSVFSINVGGVSVRSYSEIKESWSSSDEIGFWGGLIFIAIGVVYMSNAFTLAFARKKWF